MAIKTRTDLKNQALANLGVLAAGQTPDAEDDAAVDKYIDPLVAELSARDLVTIDNTDEIDDAVFLPVAILLAAQAAQEFGLPGVPTSPADPNPVASAERRIREVLYARPTSEPQRTEYY